MNLKKNTKSRNKGIKKSPVEKINTKKKLIKKKPVEKTNENTSAKEVYVEEKVKKPILKEENIIKLNPKDEETLKLTEAKIKKLLDIKHLEELLYVINILNNKQLDKFIEHYKKKQISTKDEKIDIIIMQSESGHQLFENLKKELINSLNDEYLKVKDSLRSLRKKGIDVYIEDVKAMSIPLKIKIFNATIDKKDYYTIKKIISEINEKLNEKNEQIEKHLEEKKRVEENVKKVKEISKDLKKQRKIISKIPKQNLRKSFKKIYSLDKNKQETKKQLMPQKIQKNSLGLNKQKK